LGRTAGFAGRLGAGLVAGRDGLEADLDAALGGFGRRDGTGWEPPFLDVGGGAGRDGRTFPFIDGFRKGPPRLSFFLVESCFATLTPLASPENEKPLCQGLVDPAPKGVLRGSPIHLGRQGAHCSHAPLCCQGWLSHAVRDPIRVFAPLTLHV
jgi:hypothetical protein